MAALDTWFVDPWLLPRVREEVRDRIVAIEKRTGAELVVTVGGRSGHYGHADALFGALCSLSVLLVYYFHPAPLPDDVSLATAILCYPAGMLVARAISPLRRLFCRKRLLRDNLRREARARFVDQGIGGTTGRTGVLIYVSRFERGAEVVADAGIPVEAMGLAWQDAIRSVDTAARRSRVADFLAALDKLGDALAAAVPRSDDDRNELPDEVRR
jgi:putative membrane protein